MKDTKKIDYRLGKNWAEERTDGQFYRDGMLREKVREEGGDRTRWSLGERKIDERNHHLRKREGRFSAKEGVNKNGRRN